MHIPAYCSFEYLLHLFQDRNFSGLGSESHAIAFLQLRDLITDGTDIVTDVPKEKIDEYAQNPYVRYLIKNNRIQPKPTVFSSLRSSEQVFFQQQGNCNGLYCMSGTYQPEKLRELQKKSGHYFLGVRSTAFDLFEDKVHDLVARSQSTWEFLQQMMQPHRSIVIADPYLYKLNGITACNLLLKGIVPKQLHSPYHITLIGSADRRSLKPSISHKEIKRSVDMIRQTVTANLPHAVVEFHIVNKEEFHDRLIITNNVMIYSGSGLDAIKNGEATKDSYWVAVSPYKRLLHNELAGAFGFKIIKGKLQRLKRWVEHSEQPATSNPLFL